jgi:hypothetical protein
MPISYIQPLLRAWRRMKAILFEPFSMSKWLVLAFTAWVAGILHGSAGTGPHGQWNANGHPHADPRAVLEGIREGCMQACAAAHHFLTRWPAAILILLVIPLILGIILALAWVSSRFKLIFLDNVLRNRAEVIEPWRRLGRLGDSLFLWRVGFGVATLALGLLLVALFGGLAIATAGGRWAVSAIVIGFAVLFFAVFAVAVAYAWLFLESFVVPIMHRLGLRSTAAWRELMPLLSAAPVQFFLYGLFVVALFVGAAIGIGILGVATCCIGFFVLWFPYVGVAVLLPLHVTYRLLGPEFLAQFDARFDPSAVS